MPREKKKPEELTGNILQAGLNEKEDSLVNQACYDQDTTRSKYGRKAIINQLREDGYDV